MQRRKRDSAVMLIRTALFGAAAGGTSLFLLDIVLLLIPSERRVMRFERVSSCERGIWQRVATPASGAGDASNASEFGEAHRLAPDRRGGMPLEAVVVCIVVVVVIGVFAIGIAPRIVARVERLVAGGGV